jgi:choline dehydrogenase-like flavoprotein
VWPYALPHRGADIGGRARHELNGEFLAPNGFWEIEGEPYTTAPGSNFRWFRSRIEGGRTNHYGRISLRVSPADLKARSRDGLGDDWPISYEDSRLITTRSNRLSASSERKKILPTLPTEFFCRRPSRAAPKPWSRRPAIS